MKKMISIAALTLVMAAPAFAQDAKPAIGSIPAAPIAAKVDAGKVIAPVAQTTTPAVVAPSAKIGDVKAPVTAQVTTPAVSAPVAKIGDVKAPVTAQVTTPTVPSTTPAMKAVETPKIDAGKTVEAPKTDVKPMAVGAPKIDDKMAPKVEAGKTAAPATATTTPAAKITDTKPADVKKQ